MTYNTTISLEIKPNSLIQGSHFYNLLKQSVFGPLRIVRRELVDNCFILLKSLNKNKSKNKNKHCVSHLLCPSR